ncbi:MAG: tail fiber protein [Alphaproteobacteria bacterium]|nr:tail fiber protein [Alphaproteobacteria bacterium]
MPYGANGNFTRVMNWTSDYENGIEIVCDRHDAEDDNFAQGFNVAFCRDGRATATGNFKMGGFKITGLGDGTSTNDAVNKKQLDAQNTALQNQINEISTDLSETSFIGDIKASLQTSNHGKWLLCDGQAVSRETYEDLFLLIGENFGAGDGSTTFNLPDYRGKFLRGLGGNSAQDVYTTQAEGLPNITGKITADGRNLITEGAFELDQTKAYGRTSDYDSMRYYNFDASLSNPIYGASEHVTPVNMAVNYFIKAL